MEKNHSETQKYQKAKQRVKAMKGFYNHLTVYCIVIPTLIFVNLKFEPHF
ncbi:MAG: 2TM domain-containing protein, partial [Polaribacter sp.]